MTVIDQFNNSVVPAHYYVDRVRLNRMDGPPLSLAGHWRVFVYSADRTQLNQLHADYTPSQAVIDAMVDDYLAQAAAFEAATGLTPLPPEPEP